MKRESNGSGTGYWQRISSAGDGAPRRVIVWGFFVTLVLAALFGSRPALLQPIDRIYYDFLLRAYPDNHADSGIAIVDLDEKSLARYGQWPWPRYRVAELFDRISAQEPAVIGLDMFFVEPDRTSVGRLLDDLGGVYRRSVTVTGLPAELADNDRILAGALGRGPFVLGNKFHFNRADTESDGCVMHPIQVSLVQDAEAPTEDAGLPQGSGVACNLESLSKKAAASGFVNFSPERDGVLRRVPLLARYGDAVYPSLGLAIVLRLKEIPNLVLKRHGGTLRELHYPGTTVPIDAHGQLLIKFRGARGSYDRVSAADILDGGVSPQRLRGRIVVVGTTAAGLDDFVTVPSDPIFPGVEVQAAVVDNLLNTDFIAVPAWSEAWVLLGIIILGMALSIFVACRKAAPAFVLVLVLVAGTWMVTQQMFYRWGLFVGPAFLVASLACIYLFVTVLKYRLDEKKLLASMKELLLTQDLTIESMAGLAEYRDPETGGHIQRTRRYVRLLAERLKEHEKYKHFLTEANIDMLYKSAPLHDIGKVGIPDRILLKPGRLSADEFEIMKTHTIIGHSVIESAVRRQGKRSFLTIAAEMAHSHQERWDGSGYPLGLEGDAIPISGRLMAVADVYDALTSERSYKPAFPHAEAVEIIKEGAGIHFDPDMVDAFLAIHEQFRRVASEFADARSRSHASAERDPAQGGMAEPRTLGTRI